MTEKKWFVYVSDHHEGPFSAEDLRPMKHQGKISADTFMWADGMTDWQAAGELPELKNLFQSNLEKPSAEPVTYIPSNGSSEASVTVTEVPLTLGGSSLPLAASTEISPPQEAPGILPETSEVQRKPTPSPEKKSQPQIQIAGISTPRGRWVRRIKTIAASLLLSGAMVYAYHSNLHQIALQQLPLIQKKLQNGVHQLQPFLYDLSEKIPALEKWVSPLPALEDVNPEEYAALKKAARASFEQQGAQFAVALAKTNPATPQFYVSSNLPGTQKFQILTVGISDTLVGRTSLESRAELEVNHFLGKTPVIQSQERTPLVPGEYQIFILAGNAQNLNTQSWLSKIPPLTFKLPVELPKETRILTYKTYFLGGTRDTSYSVQLKEFHEKLREKSVNELTEIKQFLATLNSQLESTLTQFNALRKGKSNSKQRHTWMKFHTEWTKLEAQLESAFQKWNSEEVKSQLFHPSLYQLTQQAEVSVMRVHQFHHGYFTTTSDPKTLEIQLGEAAASAQSVIGVLRSKVDETEKLPPTPNGMPRRLNP